MGMIYPCICYFCPRFYAILKRTNCNEYASKIKLSTVTIVPIWCDRLQLFQLTSLYSFLIRVASHMAWFCPVTVDAVHSMCSKRNKSDHSERFPFKVKTMLRHNVLKTRFASFLPLFARSLAVSLPMPVLAPVIMTVLSSRRTEELHWAQKTFLELIPEQMFIHCLYIVSSTGERG